jgi:hypothetical protein
MQKGGDHWRAVVVWEAFLEEVASQRWQLNENRGRKKVTGRREHPLSVGKQFCVCLQLGTR